ncbi:MAG: citryl-CoA lyase [Candidatus Azambacteria bacterium]|nr:citryl-CoA lyase [Candidatus Azambacteria bacterium]
MAKTIHHKDNKAFFGDTEHLQASRELSYPAMLFELFSERKPNGAELKVFELILNLTIDHGPDSPSAKAVIAAGKAGKTISEAVAAGVLEINDAHGGAGEGCMEILYRIKKDGIKFENIVSEYLSAKKKIPGYGHRIYEVDPRAELIFKTMEDLGISTEYILIAKNIETELKKQSGKNLPVNVDGAIAAALCSFGWAPRLAKALFITSRVPGLCGQFINNS